ncbi:hypothetical protein AV274_0676 [Blastocystis sp. ATCC 50177/Nand II]|uniref:Uncharacterized protein n=1 Tax=Blastocystis sp. subtype 1 (strain ATCC 50177 / NandII) TaxID=478820 RepID=A0A196SKM6_BLAHN|nr:hypothetical protein AV274_0676 [Blastocystis sp. ATCC 50177/Nand II]
MDSPSPSAIPFDFSYNFLCRPVSSAFQSSESPLTSLERQFRLVQQKCPIDPSIDRSHLSLYYIDDTCVVHALSEDVMVGFHVYRTSSTEAEIRCEVIYGREQFLVTYDQLDAHTFHCRGFAVAMKPSPDQYDVFADDGSVSSIPSPIFEGMSFQLSNEEAKKAVHFGHLSLLPRLATFALPPSLQAVLLRFARWEPWEPWESRQRVAKQSRASVWLAATFAGLRLATCFFEAWQAFFRGEFPEVAEEYALNALQAWAAGEASTRCVSQEEMAGVILQALLAPLLQAIQALRRDTESSFIASSLCELAFQTLLRSSTAHHFFGVAVEPSCPRFSSLCLSTPV